MKELKIKQWNEKGLLLLHDSLEAIRSASDPRITEEFEDKIPRHLSEENRKIHVVFAGQYSAGKSSIIKGLTGREITIGGGITTMQTQEYPWNDLILIDTPGIHTKIRPDHDAIAYDAIAKADLILFVVTAQGFSDHVGKHFRKLLLDMGKAHEMMLVVNKMLASEDGNTERHRNELVKNDILPVIGPEFKPEDLYLTFIDAKSFLEAELETDPTEKSNLIEDSHWDTLIDHINQFVQDKGIMGKCTTPIFELEQVLNEIIDSIPKDNQYADRMEHLLSQQRRAMLDAQQSIMEKVQNLSDQNTDRIISLGNEIASMITTDADGDEVNKMIEELSNEVNRIYKETIGEAAKIIQEELNELKESFEDLRASSFAKDLKRDLEMDVETDLNGKGNAQKARTVLDWVEKGGNVAAKWAINGTNYTGWDSLFKLGTYSASQGHKAILAIGHFFGYSFKPWQAVRIASYVGKVGKWLGPIATGAGIILDIWMAKKKAAAEEKVKEARQGILASFHDVANVVSKQIMDGCQRWTKENIGEQIENIDRELEELRNMSDSGGKDLELFTPLLKRTRKLIADFYRS